MIDRDAHELPDQTQYQSLCAVHNVGSLDTDQVHTVCLTEVNGVIGVFDCLESGEFLVLLWLGDPSPDDRSWDDLVESLQKDVTVLYISSAPSLDPP